MFAGVVEFDELHQSHTLTFVTYESMLQNLIALDIADCNRAWRTINNANFAVAKFVEAKGRYRTIEAQPNSVMNIEEFKFSRKVKLKWKIVEYKISESTKFGVLVVVIHFSIKR